jgi:hypothetical protein
MKTRANTTFSGYAAKFKTNEGFKHFFAKFVSQAWSSREALAFQDGERLTVPPIVSMLRRASESDREVGCIGNKEESVAVPVDGSYNMMPQQEFLSAGDFSMSQFGWPLMDWETGGSSSW